MAYKAQLVRLSWEADRLRDVRNAQFKESADAVRWGQRMKRVGPLVLAAMKTDKDLLERLSDQIGGDPNMNTSVWATLPEKVACQILGTHLHHEDRRQVLMTLLINGIQPTLIAEWMLKRRMLRDHLAVKDIREMMRKFGKGELDDKPMFKGFELRTGMWQVQQTPYDYEWELLPVEIEEAIRMLT